MGESSLKFAFIVASALMSDMALVDFWAFASVKACPRTRQLISRLLRPPLLRSRDLHLLQSSPFRFIWLQYQTLITA